jgi:hypothetical protein
LVCGTLFICSGKELQNLRVWFSRPLRIHQAKVGLGIDFHDLSGAFFFAQTCWMYSNYSVLEGAAIAILLSLHNFF